MKQASYMVVRAQRPDDPFRLPSGMIVLIKIANSLHTLLIRLTQD